MPCKAIRDTNGTTYIIPEAPHGKTIVGKVFPGLAEVAVWWAREFKKRPNETLIIRQESNPNRADVIELTLGQVYDLIHALSLSVMRP